MIKSEALSKLSCLSFSLQNFKREEQNFVVMNEINNMSFLTADSKSKMSKVRDQAVLCARTALWVALL